MSCLDVRPDELRAATAEPASGTLQPAGRGTGGTGARWWRWLAASAVFFPGGALAHHLLQEPGPSATSVDSPAVRR